MTSKPREIWRSGRRLLLPALVAVVGTVAACVSADDGGVHGRASAPASEAVPQGVAPTGLTMDVVKPTVETRPVPHAGDAADDPAVWVDSSHPARSVVVGTDKKGGLGVYDLAGRQLHYLPIGDMNNVDLRRGVRGIAPGGAATIVVAGDRTTNTLRVFRLDPRTRTLQEIKRAAVRPRIEVYGSCLYRNPRTGALYAFVDSKRGEVEQWRLSGVRPGRLVRSFAVSSQTEGCVADDALGRLYLGEEEVGIWRFGAGPHDGTTGHLVASVSAGGPLVGQVEGLALAPARGGGYLLASSQGNDSFAVFRRTGNNGFVGSFRVADARGVDGTQGTDGIEVATAPMGPAFPHGVFVAQDGVNDRGAQNFKFVPLQAILGP
jgi:3-phytase